MKILISAFDPFGNDRLNASREALLRLRAPEGVELVKLLLPTVFGKGAEQLLEAVRRELPDAVVALGQAAGRTVITPERVAINCADARIPDNAGRKPLDEPIIPGAPAAYYSTLPLKAMVAAARKASVEASISDSAGTFVCNELMYRLLHAVSSAAPAICAGFVHVPCLPEQSPVSSMPLDEIVRGLEAMLSVL